MLLFNRRIAKWTLNALIFIIMTVIAIIDMRWNASAAPHKQLTTNTFLTQSLEICVCHLLDYWTTLSKTAGPAASIA